MSRLLTALVIGNAAYEGSSKLKNPGNDADDVAVKLEASGFEAVKMIDCANADLDRALKRFKRGLVGNEYGGHLAPNSIHQAESSSAQFVKLGHSWGSFLGIQVAARAPDRFHAYNSAHSPLFEEPLRAREILRRDVLAQQVGLADATP